MKMLLKSVWSHWKLQSLNGCFVYLLSWANDIVIARDNCIYELGIFLKTKHIWLPYTVKSFAVEMMQSSVGSWNHLTSLERLMQNLAH